MKRPGGLCFVTDKEKGLLRIWETRHGGTAKTLITQSGDQNSHSRVYSNGAARGARPADSTRQIDVTATLDSCRACLRPSDSPSGNDVPFNLDPKIRALKFQTISSMSPSPGLGFGAGH